MKNFITLLAGLCLATFLMGCGNNNPISPSDEITPEMASANYGISQTHLWGYYDVHIDVDSKTVVLSPNRTVMVAYNVVTFLNGNFSSLKFDIKGIVDSDPSLIDIDIDISLTHPFPGLTQYNGYDVRGIFMGNGNGYSDYKDRKSVV